MKVWITKYALSSGITEADAEVCLDVNDGMVRIHRNASSYDYFHKPYWHETREEAVAHAESMRVKKIESLKKNITKLEKTKF